jgi:hypothetical protein
MELSGFCRWWQRKKVRTALVVAIALAVLFVAVSGTQRALFGSSEFMAFRQIVQVSLVQNMDHYKAIPHVRAYPPFFAVLWSPFGAFPVGVISEGDKPPVHPTLAQELQLGASAAAVVLLMLAFTCWSVRCIAGACRARAGGLPSEQGSGRPCLPVLIWILAGGLMLNSIVRVETDMFVVMLVAGGMYGRGTGRAGRCWASRLPSSSRRCSSASTCSAAATGAARPAWYWLASFAASCCR